MPFFQVQVARQAAELGNAVQQADPGTGVMRHADAGYDGTVALVRTRGIDDPRIQRSKNRPSGIPASAR